MQSQASLKVEEGGRVKKSGRGPSSMIGKGLNPLSLILKVVEESRETKNPGSL